MQGRPKGGKNEYIKNNKKYKYTLSIIYLTL